MFYLTVLYLEGIKTWIPVIFFPVLYFLTGSFSILFLGLITIYFLINVKKENLIKLNVLYVLSSLFFFIAQEFLFYQTIRTLILYPFPERNIGDQKLLFISVVALISLLPLIFRFYPKSFNKIKIRKIHLEQKAAFQAIAVFALLSVWRIDKKNIHYFHAEKLFCEQKIDQLIAFNTQFPSLNILTNFLNNIALAETGKLNEVLFQFPQSPDGSSLFLKWKLADEVIKQGGYFYNSVGMINEAQRWA